MQLTSLETKVAEQSRDVVTFELVVGYRIDDPEVDAQLPWLLDVTVTGYGSRETGPGGRVPLPLKTKASAVARPALLLRRQADRESGTGTHTFRCKLERAQFAVPDNDQYLVAARLIPDVQAKPSNKMTAVIREDL